MAKLTKKAQVELRQMVQDEARRLIDNQDYLGLQRLHARLIPDPTFDEAVFDMLICASAMADDMSLRQAAAYIKNNMAMGCAGVNPYKH